jgi:hypothetical protein
LPGGTCKVIGQACANGSDCCSTNCQGGFCAKAYYCQATGDVCGSDEECCGHVCSADNDGGVGRCITVTGGGGGGCTRRVGSRGGNCCSRTCVDPGSGDGLPRRRGCRLTAPGAPTTRAAAEAAQTPTAPWNAGAPTPAAVPPALRRGTACNPVSNICEPVLPDGSINALAELLQRASVGKDVCKLVAQASRGASAAVRPSVRPGTGEAPAASLPVSSASSRTSAAAGRPACPGPTAGWSAPLPAAPRWGGLHLVDRMLFGYRVPRDLERRQRQPKPRATRDSRCRRSIGFASQRHHV